MLKQLHKGNEDERRIKIIEVARRRDARYLPQLLARLDGDESLSNKRHIVRALGKIADARAERVLIRLLDTESGLMLGDFLRSLGELKSATSVPRARLLLNHESEWVRQNARWLLVQLRHT